MKIATIIGGGHIGSTLAGYLSVHGNFSEVRLLTSKHEKFDRHLVVNDIEKGVSYNSDIKKISNNPEEVVKDSDVIFVTYPHFMIEKSLEEIKDYLKPGAMVGIIPGSGGCEFFWKKKFDSSHTLFGFQRVPFTAKNVIYGKETNLKSWKPAVVVASIPISRNDEVCDVIENYCNFKCIHASNFLAITLTPSNPVLHTSRTYDIYCDYSPDHLFPDKGLYYRDWTDRASEILFGIDSELQSIIKRIDRIDLTSVLPLGLHYEAPTVKDMTNKIQSIPTFKSVPIARIEVDGKYKADLKSRYFTEDYPWGLCILKGFAEIVGVKTPTMDKVLRWFQDFVNKEYYVGDRWSGKDLIYTGVPQNFGIHTLEDIYAFYLTNQQ